jgi:hypothetical protein
MTSQSEIKGLWANAISRPPPCAFHVEHVIDPFTEKACIGMVRHARHAFVIPRRSSAPALNDIEASRYGLVYLKALAQAIDVNPGDGQWIDSRVWQALCTPREVDECRFGWLRINWGGPAHDMGSSGRKGTLGSFWANRLDANGGPMAPRQLVLLAGTVVEQYSLQAGSDVGLRIVMHVDDEQVRIFGVTLNGLSGGRAIDAVPNQLQSKENNIFELVSRVNRAIGSALKCENQVWTSNIETRRRPNGQPGLLTATGVVLRWKDAGALSDLVASTPNQKLAASKGNADRPAKRARAYDFRVDVQVTPNTVEVTEVQWDGYIGSGAAPNEYTKVRAFVQDAASQGPAHTLRERRSVLDDDVLDAFRCDIDLSLEGGGALLYRDDPAPQHRNGARKQKKRAVAASLFETRGASGKSDNLIGGKTVKLTDRGVVEISAPAGSKAPSASEPVLRSDTQASIETHVRAAELFERLKGYGIDPYAYFRFARLPLVQRARPAMRWAPDGELPSAEVRPFMGDEAADGGAPPTINDRLQLLVKYGSADPVHRRELPLITGDTKRMKAQYLGVASDPRWAWHEFGHVLNFASTGELEFPFAHSAGDALAAIAADPQSALATADNPTAEIRHVTFPWIEVPGRSHGRSAAQGYGWCGCGNLTRLNFTGLLERYSHGYFGEQMMSSSLFRLYRSLGGDTRGPADAKQSDQLKDEDTRLAASDYCIYLIIRAISLLGPDSLAAARTPDQFVSALIDADLGTNKWDVEAIWPFNRDKRAMNRQGGRVHKVIRWAFEQQGLYATKEPLETVDAVGLAPEVDVYISDAERPGGGYEPVPLRCDANEKQGWHADGNALRRSGQKVTVRVSNRGGQPAQGVSLRLWWGTPNTRGDSVNWRTAPTPSGDSTNIDSEKSAEISVQLPSQAGKGKLWFLVSADAPADPSNLAQGTKPPKRWDELMELVAHDNNLALGRA